MTNTLESGATAMPTGERRRAASFLSVPNVIRCVPDGVNACTLEFPVSAT